MTESYKPKQQKEFTNSFYQKSKEDSTWHSYVKHETYVKNYDSQYVQKIHKRPQDHSKDLTLMINNKKYIIKNYEEIDNSLFGTKLKDCLAKIGLDSETLLITEIKILNELKRIESKHFNQNQYDQLLSKFINQME